MLPKLKVCRTWPVVLISATPPGLLVPLNTGTEMKKVPVFGSQTDCSRPPPAGVLGMTMLPLTIRPVLALISVPNGAVSALLATSSRLVDGE
jgi:hypothetical protein